MSSIALLVIALVGIGIIGYSVYLLRQAEGDPLSARIEDYAAREEIVSIEEIQMSMPISQRLFLPVIRRISNFIVRLTPEKTLEATARKLDLAGNPRNMSAAEFWAIRALVTVVFTALTFMFLTRFGSDRRFLYTFFGALIGFYGPAMLLRSIIDRRKDAVIKKLPDALDLMLICVEAGQTFNGAMQRVDDKWDDPLAREFGRTNYEMQLGKSRRQALRDMSDRLGVADVSSFVAAIIQADQLGVGIGKVLRIQSEQMRIKRRQRAEEKAQQAPVKMLFPMVFLIFPSMFVVLLGPAGFQIMRNSALRGI
jgi:tight adherence protein C